MNNKFFNKKYRQMSALFKTKTTFRSKFYALGALLLVLNFGVAWGQTEIINMTQTSRTVDVDCGKTYTFELQANNATATRTYIFRPDANTSITISSFTFHAVRQYANSYWSSIDLRDYLEISYGSTTLTYGNDANSWGDRCHRVPVGQGYNSVNHDYYHKNVTVPEITVPAGEEVTFTFHRSTDYTSGGNCTKANFSARLATSICCPTLTAPTNGAVVEASGFVTLTWGAMSGVTSYDVYVNNARVAQSVQNTSYQYSGLVDGTTYTWKVVPAGANATNYSHCSPYTFKACSGISCATNLQPADGTVLTDRLISWDAVECASSYEVFVTPTSVPVTQMYAKNTDNTYKYLVAEPTST